MARELAAAFDAPLHASTVSRLLIELNRSPRHPQLYSEITRGLPREQRRELFERCYLPYRSALEQQIASLVALRKTVIHISSHSFTPQLHGAVRNADIGLLYDPARPGEAALCRRWRQAVQEIAPACRVRLNYPYAGAADGFTTWLRRRFAPQDYIGIELEINQKHVAPQAQHWRPLRAALIAALQRAAASG
jgi:predicted N-formylglutamate amidohydrolase